MQTIPLLFYWKVSYPINNYNVTLNVGEYEHLSDVYVADDGDSPGAGLLRNAL